MDVQHTAVHQLEHTAHWLLTRIAGDGTPPADDRQFAQISELAAQLVPVLNALAYLDHEDHDHEH